MVMGSVQTVESVPHCSMQAAPSESLDAPLHAVSAPTPRASRLVYSRDPQDDCEDTHFVGLLLGFNEPHFKGHRKEPAPDPTVF